MSDYNLDNDGTGFEVEEDLDKLFDDAESASEDTQEGNTEAFFDENYSPGDELKGDEEENDDNSAFEFDDDFTIEAENKESNTSENNGPQEATGATVVGDHEAHKEIVEENSFAPENAIDENNHDNDVQFDQNNAAPEEQIVDLEKENHNVPTENNFHEEELVDSSSSHNFDTPDVKRPRVIMPNIEDSINNVQQIINILDAYRKLNDNEKNVAGQFITGGDVVNSESEFIVKVINVDRMLPITMKALGEAKHRDPVERAFYVIELDSDILYNLGSLVSVFMADGQEPTPSNSNTQYAREVVRCIDALTAEDMRYVEATELVLSASERKNN